VADLARRAALAREVRESAAAGHRMTLEVSVLERHGWWRMSVSALPCIQTDANRRSEIEPAVRQAIAAALQVPGHMFDLHFRIEG
jgi:hypothetical protein